MTGYNVLTVFKKKRSAPSLIQLKKYFEGGGPLPEDLSETGKDSSTLSGIPGDSQSSSESR